MFIVSDKDADQHVTQARYYLYPSNTFKKTSWPLIMHINDVSPVTI